MSIWRWTIGAVFALTGMWLVGAFTFSLVYARGAPTAALGAWATSRARSGVAASVITSGLDAKNVARAAALSRAALAREPVNVEAARTLGLAYAARNHLDAARRLIAYAEQLSRRDLPTQLWLIEDRSAAGDIPGTLVHYDHAMQTSQSARGLLSPVLAAAANDLAIARPLAPILRRRPEWWSNFLGDFVDRTTSPKALLLLTQSLRLNPAEPTERVRLSTALQRLVKLDAPDQARALFERIAKAPDTPVVDGGFERDTGLPPFGWQLVELPAAAGVREQRDGARGKFALTLDGNEGQEVARQLLVLAPGRYVLRFLFDQVRPGFLAPPSVALRCGAADTSLAAADMPSASTATSMQVPFTVPAGCTTQAIAFYAPRASGYIDQKPWVDDVAIMALGR